MLKLEVVSRQEKVSINDESLIDDLKSCRFVTLIGRMFALKILNNFHEFNNEFSHKIVWQIGTEQVEFNLKNHYESITRYGRLIIMNDDITIVGEY